MAAAAIDLGSMHTRLAIFDRRTRKPVLVTEWPNAVYVPREGAILFGHAARDAISQDPAGAIEDLNSRLGDESIRRNRRVCRPAELITQLIQDIRIASLGQMAPGELLASCVITIPVHCDLQQAERLLDAARHAGFNEAASIDEPVAVARGCERQQPIPGDVAVVCDLGRSAKIGIVRRVNTAWRTDLEISGPPPIARPVPGVPRLALDGLREISTELGKRGVAAPPLLLAGGGATTEGLADEFKLDGWPGEVLIPPDTSLVTVLGAVDIEMDSGAITCPECQFFPVARIALSCPECGFPLRPSPIHSAEGITGNPGAALRVFAETVTKSCPECAATVARNAISCPTCGYPLTRDS